MRIKTTIFILLLLLPMTTHAIVIRHDLDKSDYHYTGTLKINDQSGRIDADWQITIDDNSETAITFLLRDTLEDINVTGTDVADVSIEKQSGLGEFWAINVTLKPATKNRTVHMSYSGVLIPEPMKNRINAIEPGRVELNVDSFWFPIDSRFTKFLTADLKVIAGEGWQGVTTGEAAAIEGGFRILNTDPRIDITFSLSKSFHITEANGFTIYDQRKEHEGTDRLVATATQCQSFLNSRFGTIDPLPVGKLLITERSSSGYARENYIAFTDVSETKPGPLMRFVCHEFAHYWSRGAKFDTVDNWINEAFAEYLGLMAVREHLGQDAYDEMLVAFAKQIADKELPHIWKPGDTERSSYEVQYRKGPLKLAELEKNIGAETFLKFVQNYFVSKNKSTEGLLSVLESTAGTDQRTAFETTLAK